jgi:hypothetical protein
MSDFNQGVQKGAGGCLGVFLMILAILIVLSVLGRVIG